MSFRIPDQISATDGASGNQEAELTLSDGSRTITCTYRGSGRHDGATYDFDSCFESDGSAGPQAGEIHTASSFNLHVVNGDHGNGNALGKTEVELFIDNNDTIDSPVCRGRRGFEDRVLSGLGGNGRACSDCHMHTDQFQLRPSNAERRFQRMVATGIDDPLFRPVDADDFQTNGNAASDFTNLRRNGLVRLHFELPPPVPVFAPATNTLLGFVDVKVIDPVTNMPVKSVDVWRATPSVLNVNVTGADCQPPFLGPPPLFGCPSPPWARGPNRAGGYQLDARVDTLQNQALGAFVNHAQVQTQPPQSLLDDIAEFEKTLVTPPTPPEPPLTKLEQDGKVIFERACAQCHGGAGGSTPINDAVAALPAAAIQHYQDISTTCPRPVDTVSPRRWDFNNSASALACNPQTSPPSGVHIAKNVRTYEITFQRPDGTVIPECTQLRSSSDPGRALLTGFIFSGLAPAGGCKCQPCGPVNLDDWQKFDIAPLRGISKTAPYFHNNSAATLEDVVIHYEEVFNRAKALNPNAAILIRATSEGLKNDRGNVPDERKALVAYLKTL